MRMTHLGSSHSRDWILYFKIVQSAFLKMSEHVQISALEISGSHGAMGNVCKYQSNASQKCNLFKKVCVVHRCNLKSEKIFCLAKQLLVLYIYYKS